MTECRSSKTVSFEAQTEHENHNLTSVAGTVPGISTCATSSCSAEMVDSYSEKESAMVFEFCETFNRDEHPSDSDESSPNTATHGFDELIDNHDLTDPLISEDTSDQLPVIAVSHAERDIFHCTLPVVVRQRMEMEARGINAARRKHRQMFVCNSDCSTLSSHGTMRRQPSYRDTDSPSCGCFRMLKLPIGAARSTPAAASSWSPSGATLAARTLTFPHNIKNDDRRLMSLVTIGHRTQTPGCASPPSAVQTFSFADTKIGNAVSAVSGTDGGLVVRVNSCRGGQHIVSEKYDGGSATFDPREVNDLNMFIDGHRSKPNADEGRRWQSPNPSGFGSDSTGNFTLVPRRCTEVHRGFGLRRRRWQHTTPPPNNDHRPHSELHRSGIRQHRQLGPNEDEETSSFELTMKSSRLNVTKPRPSEWNESRGTASINSVIGNVATSVWRRLVAGFEVAADDGRRLFANCKHHNDDGLGIGLLGRTAGRSYDLMTS